MELLPHLFVYLLKLGGGGKVLKKEGRGRVVGREAKKYETF